MLIKGKHYVQTRSFPHAVVENQSVRSESPASLISPDIKSTPVENPIYSADG